MKFNHIGIPTATRSTAISLPHLKVTVSDHLNNPFGIQWQRYWDDAPYPELVKTVPHVAFEVDDLRDALEAQHVIIEPNSPSAGVMVAFIEVNGAPVELMQIDHERRPDLSEPGLPRTSSTVAAGATVTVKAGFASITASCRRLTGPERGSTARRPSNCRYPTLATGCACRRWLGR